MPSIHHPPARANAPAAPAAAHTPPGPFLSPVALIVIERRCQFLSGANGLGLWCESNSDARCRICELRYCAAHMTEDRALCELCILATPRRAGRKGAR